MKTKLLRKLRKRFCIYVGPSGELEMLDNVKKEVIRAWCRRKMSRKLGAVEKALGRILGMEKLTAWRGQHKDRAEDNARLHDYRTSLAYKTGKFAKSSQQ